MAEYCFRCPSCGYPLTSPVREPAPTHRQADGLGGGGGHDSVMVRDYKAEGVGVQTLELKRVREAGGTAAVRDMFLPTRKDFKGPGDPDGAKGMREWVDQHDPKPGNKTPMYPADVPKRSW